jgi:large subunit ribosomal protein L5
MNAFQQHYQEKIAPELAKEFGIGNSMAIPKLVKIVINCGMGEALKDKKSIEKMGEQLGIITGQKAVVTRAKKAIASFHTRENDPIGLKVTLRGKRMNDFLTRYINLALPRVRDFRGIPKNGFDGQGNYTVGIREQTIFPEIEFGMIDRVRGFEATFVTTARNDKEAFRLLQMLGLPFEK